MPSIAENIHTVSKEIRRFETQYQRPSDSVHLLAVSKKQQLSSIVQAYAAGITQFGENYLSEAEEKIDELARTHPEVHINWHFIGPLQSNKTARVSQLFNWVHSVDRLKLAQRLSRQRPEDLPSLNICVQVKLSGEPSKSGVAVTEASALCQAIAPLPKLRLRGLMAIPAPEHDLDKQREVFAQLKALMLTLTPKIPSMDTLSIGMSKDYQAAIAEGSTIVRLGTALFGERRLD